MKSLFALIAFSILCSFLNINPAKADFGGLECFVNNKAGEHLEFNEKSTLLNSGEPFGLVRITKTNGRYHLSSFVGGEETIVSFKKELSISKQSATGITGGAGNIVCN